MLFVSSVILFATVRSSVSGGGPGKSKPQPTPFQDWDYIVYSQRWPITSCTQWEERSSNNTCALPKNPNNWLVHGVWPTKTGAKGPFFCNSAIHFDMDQLQPMMPQLQEYWTNVEANTKPNSFWKHEWSKHGTCASTLPQLDSVTNYFGKGLQWNQEYNVTDILNQSNIVPNLQGYNVSDLYNSIKAFTGKNPTVECVVDGKTKESLISEIRFCFNKTLDLIDCNVSDGIGLQDDVLGNCNRVKNVMYLAAVPNSTQLHVEECKDNNYDFMSLLLEIYDLVKFLMWFTL